MTDLQKDSIHDVWAERRRQLVKGYDASHDDGHYSGELLMAALAYMCAPGESLWPFEPESFHPSDDPIENLTIAASFICAEADRLKRCHIHGRPVVGGFLVLGVNPEEITEMVDGLREIRAEMRELGDGRSD